MIVFNAVRIEHTLARFFGRETGERGTFFDADVFRRGDPKDLALIVRNVADRIEARSLFIRFPSDANGSAKAQVEGCVSQLRTFADRVLERSAPEREDYHWELFGALMLGIVGLLETLEEQIPLH